MALIPQIYAGDEVFVDDGQDIVAHVRRANMREVFIFIEDTGDFTVSRETVKSVSDGKIVLFCRKLPLPFRAAIHHLHGEKYDEDEEN